jgi:predicted PhzF superfamily epimerase YddE/YHI9
MAELHVLRVFTAPDGTGGNPLGVFLDGPAVPEDRRQAVAADLGFSETVFVLDPASGRLRIFTPAAELPFAGHPLVGAGWLLARERTAVAALRPPAGEVPTWLDDGGVTWIRGRAEWAPTITFRQLGGPGEVDALAGPPDGLDMVDCWAWEDEPAGRVRARVFAPRYGIAEDEATGAAAVRLVDRLGRPVTIRQGAGSLLRARPGPDGSAEVGGLVVLDEVRDYPVEPGDRSSGPPDPSG